MDKVFARFKEISCLICELRLSSMCLSCDLTTVLQLVRVFGCSRLPCFHMAGAVPFNPRVNVENSTSMASLKRVDAKFPSACTYVFRYVPVHLS